MDAQLARTALLTPPLRRWVPVFMALCAWLGCNPMNLSAQEMQQGKVTYVTSTVAYVDLGTRHGFTEGDTVRVIEPNGSVAAVLLVEHVASSSMATKVLTKTRTIVAGDSARGEGSMAVKPIRPTLMVDSTTLQSPPPTPQPSPRAVQKEQPLREDNSAHGRVSLQYHALANSSTAGLVFSQPAAVFNIGIDRIAGSPLAFSMYSNHRYDARPDDVRRRAPDPRLRNRVYEFALRYGALDDPFRMAAGRFLMHAIGGVGTFDGAMVIQQFGQWEAGIAGGSQPGYRDSEIATDDPKFAGYVRFTEGDYGGVRYQGSLAYAQSYRSSNLDRGFFYFQNTLSLANSISVYQNLNIDMYDLEDNEGKTSPHITDFFLSGNYRPLRTLAITGSYSLRRNVFLMETFGELNAQYFDKSYNQNFQIGAGYNIGNGMFANLTASLRTREGDDQNATALYGRYTFSNVLASGFNMYLLGSIAENRYNRTSNIGFEVNRDLVENLYTSVRLQRVHYTYLLTDRNIERFTLAMDAYYRLARSMYLSLSYERAFETTLNTDRLYTEITWRF